MSPVIRTLSRLLACWLLLTTAGCATLNLTHLDLRSRKATARNPVVRVVCLWEPAEGRDPKGNPCHGFAGQILFLNASSLPVTIDGDVRVYLFDDQGTAEEQAQPLHKFDFDNGAWAQHYTYGTLGPAYNVFVPYMRKGVYEATCALRLRLTPKQGPAIFSEMASIELMSFQTGTKSSTKAPRTDSRVEAASAEDLTSVNKRRRTTTISLDAGNGGATDALDLPGTATDNKVQLAGYESEPRPLTSADAKIAQLEQMVKALREQQSDQLPPVRAAAPATVLPSAPPRRLNDSGDDHTRFRVRPTGSTSTGSTPAEPNPKDADLVEPSASMRSVLRPANSAVTERQRHPLDDDAPVAVKLSQPTAHSLSEAKVPFARQGSEASSEANRPATRRHPLDEPTDQQLAPARTATRKVIPAANDPSPARPDHGSTADPFDPIDIEAIETTAVDERQITRQQLRAVSR